MNRTHPMSFHQVKKKTDCQRNNVTHSQNDSIQCNKTKNYA